MITLLLFSILLVLSLWKAKKYQDIFHPLVLYFIPFFIQYIVYLLVYKRDNPISQKTFNIYISSIVIFIVFYCVFEGIFNHSIQMKKSYTMVVAEKKTLKWIAFFTVSALTIEIGSTILSKGLSTAYRYMRFQVNYGDGMSIFSKYLPVLYNTVFITWITGLIRKKEIKDEKLNVILYTTLFFVIAFFSFSRTNLLMAACAFGYCILQNRSDSIKGGFKRLLYIIISVILILYVFSWIANATNKMGDTDINSSNFYIWKYLGYPIITMDKYVTPNPGIASGLYSLGIIGKALTGLGFLHVGDLGVLPVTGQFNVFSYIGNIYLDYGNGYFIVHIIIAMLVSFLYNKNKICGEKWTVLYAFYSYAIVISFYSYQYSLTLYIYIFILLCTLKKDKINTSANNG